MSPWHLNGDSSLPSVAADGQQYKFLEWPRPFFSPLLWFLEKTLPTSNRLWPVSPAGSISRRHYYDRWIPRCTLPTDTHASALLTLNDPFYPTGTFHVATLFPPSLHLTPDFPLQLSKQNVHMGSQELGSVFISEVCHQIETFLRIIGFFKNIYLFGCAKS